MKSTSSPGQSHAVVVVLEVEVEVELLPAAPLLELVVSWPPPPPAAAVVL